MRILGIAVTGLMLFLASTGCRAQLANANEPGLRAEVDSLKKELAQLKKELEEVRTLAPIKQLLDQNKPLDVTIDLGGSPAMGDADAALTLIEFSDFQCPYCGRHAQNTYPQLKKNYVEEGKLQYVFMDFPLRNHPQAPKAAEAAYCAGEQDRYWEMHDRLFSHQQELAEDLLPGHADSLGLDVAAFSTCLDSGKYADIVQTGLQHGQSVGVRGTPSFALGYTRDGGKSVRVVKLLRGALPYNQFVTAFDDLTEASQ
jgi:protein-disulfide isomerase